MKSSNPLAGTRPSVAPPELRSQVLASIQSVPLTKSQDLWERVWNSRRLRFAWLVTVLLLIALNLAPGPYGTPRPHSSPRSKAPGWASIELAVLGLQGPTLRRYENSSRGLTAGDQLELIKALRDDQ
jgi:hypothetical protein